MFEKEKSGSADAATQAELKSRGAIPTHIAIIMDGNGRWAKAKGRTRVMGHREGVRSVKDIVEACGELGVKYLTLFAFSTENWRRPLDEVGFLMRLLVSSLRDEIRNLHDSNVRLTSIGDLDKLPRETRKELLRSVELTAGNTGLTLNLALSYSGRWDLAQAMRKMAQLVRNGDLDPEDIDDALIASFLSTAEMPDPDLLIRTSGEMRISNFLLWQAAYTEFYISEAFWPEFRRPLLYDAIRSFQKRERRFGLVSEQLVGSSCTSSIQEPLANAIPQP